MMQDAQDAFGENVPDEVTTAFDLIRRQLETEGESRVDNTCPMVFGVADKLYAFQECRAWLFVHLDSAVKLRCRIQKLRGIAITLGRGNSFFDKRPAQADAAEHRPDIQAF